MNEGVDAIVLAGDQGASNDFATINNTAVNKLSLEIKGKPLLIYVLQALQAVGRIQRIVIIGPSLLIRSIIERHHHILDTKPKISVLEQGESAYDNFWSAFTTTLPCYTQGLEDHNESFRNKCVLVVPCDTPLMSGEEIDEFLEACNTQSLDYCVGMTKQQYLERFMATETLAGFNTNYLHLASGSFRLNNLHLIRPFAVHNRRFIQRIFEIRYQKRFINILSVSFEMMRIRGLGWRALKIYMLLQLSSLCARLPFARWTAFFRQRVTLEEVTKLACTMLVSRVGIIETTLGGCAIDIDNASDFAMIKQRFDEFTRLSSQPHRPK